MNNMAIVENKYTDQTWLTIRNDRQIVIDRLRGMIVNGKNLTNQEIIALTDYSLANDLNPFAGECYMIPNVGPTAGIAGYRRKAMEQLYKEVAMTGEKFNGENYSIDYEPAENSEANFVPGKDIAWKATLTDTLSKRQWLKQVFNAAGELKKVFPDVDFGEIIKQAEKLVGACPSWWAVGVVKGEESFGRDMFDRNERAKKRAAKLVLKARFPGVRFPEETIDIDEPERVEIIEPSEIKTQNELAGKSSDDLVKELGFEVSPAPQKPAQTNGNARPYSPEVLRTRITESVKDFASKKAIPATATRNMIAVNLEVCFAGDPAADKIRHSVMKYLVGKDSVKDMSDAEILALNKWLNVTKDSGGAYTPDPLAVKEANSVWRECLLEAGQQELSFESTAIPSSAGN